MDPKKTFLELPLGRHLSVMGRYYYGALLSKLSMIDIDKHYSLLMILSRSEQPLTQQMLGEQLHIDKTSMVRIIDGLVEKGYVERQQSLDDRRCQKIILTEVGISILPEIEIAVKELNGQVMNGLSEEDQACFYRALCAISKNLHVLPSEEVQIEYHRNTQPNSSI
jgi:DNA-binding MarR family transcriptional regulator